MIREDLPDLEVLVGVQLNLPLLALLLGLDRQRLGLLGFLLLDLPLLEALLQFGFGDHLASLRILVKVDCALGSSSRLRWGVCVSHCDCVV